MKMVRLATLVLMTLFLLAVPAFAQGQSVAEESAVDLTYKSGVGVGAGLGMGLAVVGAGIGLGLVGFAALSSIARQPELAGRLFINMIILAALIEGVALAVVVFSFLMSNKI
jgi:F-type H+-transporting ATPase subunit c